MNDDLVVTIEGEKWLALERVAQTLSCHINTVRALIRCDRLPGKRMRRGRWWVREVDLARWLTTSDNRCPMLTKSAQR